MSNPTTPFGWQMPTNTDLVTNLPADFEVFGQAVASSLADLNGGTTGQILSKATNADMDFTWVSPNPGDITAITATSPLTGGGTSGDVTVGIQAASTTQSGAVQLTDSTSSTSTTTAATPNAVKTSFDLANAAIPKSTVTTVGDVIYATGSGAVTRLGIGSTGQVLSVSGGIPAWTTPAASGGDVVRIATSSFSGSSTVNVDSCFSTTYDNYLVLMNVTSSSGTNAMNFRFRTGGTTNTTTNYGSGWTYNAFGSGGATGNLGSALGSDIAYIHDITGNSTFCTMTINNPYASTKTGATFSVAQGNGYHDTGAIIFSGTTSFDGLSFISAAGTITGTISVYGYKKA